MTQGPPQEVQGPDHTQQSPPTSASAPPSEMIKSSVICLLSASPTSLAPGVGGTWAPSPGMREPCQACPQPVKSSHPFPEASFRAERLLMHEDRSRRKLTPAVTGGALLVPPDRDSEQKAAPPPPQQGHHPVQRGEAGMAWVPSARQGRFC